MGAQPFVFGRAYYATRFEHIRDYSTRPEVLSVNAEPHRIGGLCGLHKANASAINPIPCRVLCCPLISAGRAALPAARCARRAWSCASSGACPSSSAHGSRSAAQTTKGKTKQRAAALPAAGATLAVPACRGSQRYRCQASSCIFLWHARDIKDLHVMPGTCCDVNTLPTGALRSL